MEYNNPFETAWICETNPFPKISPNKDAEVDFGSVVERSEKMKISCDKRKCRLLLQFDDSLGRLDTFDPVQLTAFDHLHLQESHCLHNILPSFAVDVSVSAGTYPTGVGVMRSMDDAALSGEKSHVCSPVEFIRIMLLPSTKSKDKSTVNVRNSCYYSMSTKLET